MIFVPYNKGKWRGFCLKALDVYASDTVTCHLSQSVGYEMEAMHIHDVYEIYMALSDQVRFFVNNGMYLLEENDIILFKNNDLHKVSVPQQKLYSRYIITFPPDVLCTQFSQAKTLLTCFDWENDGSRHLKLTAEEQARFLSLAQEMEQEKSQPNFSDISRWLNLGQMLLLLCEIQSRCSKENPVNDAGNFVHIQKVLQYIDENYTDNISLDTLSSYCFLNKSYLCRLFKRETGFHIHDYIVYRRLSQAMLLLRNGESVNNAARLSGFSSDTFFITVFRQQLGMTPYQYAKKFKANCKTPLKTPSLKQKNVF